MPTLITVLGPTASGKTARAIELAKQFDTEIVSCDSRQFYSELNIGVARPTPEELAEAPHHFIACRSVCAPYNVYDYEHDALKLLNQLFTTHDTVIAVGGSGLYVEALCHGMAYLPDPAPGLREELKRRIREEGLPALLHQLKELDPAYYDKVDQANPVRVQRALEVCITSGRPYSEILAEQQPEPRPFDIRTELVRREPAELRERINRRVDTMMRCGLPSEAQSLFNLRHLNTLHTVGYREFFSIWEEQGTETPSNLTPDQLNHVADDIKMNTWHYAKKQMTWLKKKTS